MSWRPESASTQNLEIGLFTPEWCLYLEPQMQFTFLSFLLSSNYFNFTCVGGWGVGGVGFAYYSNDYPLKKCVAVTCNSINGLIYKPMKSDVCRKIPLLKRLLVKPYGNLVWWIKWCLMNRQMAIIFVSNHILFFVWL